MIDASIWISCLIFVTNDMYRLVTSPPLTKPIDKDKCAATTVAGTTAILKKAHNAHFVAMIRPPGTGKGACWNKVDPQLSLGGPQVFNTRQCGGYSALIEGQAIKKYSSTRVQNANEAPHGIKQFCFEICLKIATWFAGSRNKAKGLAELDKDVKGTAYSKMADFNACELAEHFGGKENLDKFLQKRESAESTSDDAEQKSASTQFPSES
jgi:hypothetical protein